MQRDCRDGRIRTIYRISTAISGRITDRAQRRGVRYRRAVTEQLFSYGTLRQDDVQQSLFGRTVPSVADAIPGYRLEWVPITDPRVIATSGSDRHPVLRRGTAADRVEGALLAIDVAELAAADDYEVDHYVRIRVTLASGVDAWVYVAGND